MSFLAIRDALPEFSTVKGATLSTVADGVCLYRKPRNAFVPRSLGTVMQHGSQGPRVRAVS